ncbi:Lipopolysaccharide kinase (Kdo/WaaP) family protein [compost metagenome]
MHGCFYPKHIFLRERSDGWLAQLIDLEKTRPLLLGMRDRLKDLEPLLRRAPNWSEAEVRLLLASYLDQPADSPLVDSWLQRLVRRRREKEAR